MLAIESGNDVSDTRITIVALEAQKSAPAHTAIDANGADATPSSLVKFIAAQSADKFCQAAARNLSQADTDFTLKNEDEIVQRVLVDGGLHTLVLYSTRKSIFKLSHHPPSFGHSVHHLEYSITQKTIIGRSLPEIYTEQ